MKAEKYLLVACTELYTHYLVGARSLQTFKASVLKDLTGSVIVHDRYQNYDSVELGPFIHQLCCAHLLRDADDAAEVHPDAVWPTQIGDALRGLIHQANLARERATPPSPPRSPTRWSSCSVRVCWSACPPPPAAAPAPDSARPGCCWKSYATGRPTSCASPTT